MDDLERRIVELEKENASLRSASEGVTRRRAGRLRTTVASVLIVVGALLAPVAALGAWARVELVDTDRFVATFAPLASDPDVQDFIAAQATAAIETNVDLDSLVGDVFDGIQALGLPPRADASLELLRVPAAQGLRSIIGNVVDEVVAAPAFAEVWAQTLRFTHERAISVIQGDPTSTVVLSDDGTLSVRLDAVVSAVKVALVERGVGFADAIPVIDREIPVMQADSLVLVRTVYTVAVAAGYWLPWVVLALIVAGVCIAVRPVRAMFWASLAFAAGLALLGAGLGVGRLFFLSAVSPSVMPGAAAEAVFMQLTQLMGSTIVALVLLGVLVAIAAWLAGGSPSAGMVRSSVSQLSLRLRRSGEAHGVTTGSLGVFVERWRSAILLLIVIGGVLIVLLNRPPSVGGVIGVMAGIGVLVLLVELVRRPAVDLASPDDEMVTAEKSV